MNLTQWFNKGLTIDEYKDAQKSHTESFFSILSNFKLHDDPFYDQFSNKDVRIVAIVEEWCGHCMLNVPLLINLCEKTNTPVRFLPRDEHPELMDKYLTDGKKIIPIFIFIDEDGNEIAKWGPVADEVNKIVNTYRKHLPEKDSDEYEEAFQTFIKEVSEAFETDEKVWHASYKDIKRLISEQVL